MAMAVPTDIGRLQPTDDPDQVVACVHAAWLTQPRSRVHSRVPPRESGHARAVYDPRKVR